MVWKCWFRENSQQWEKKKHPSDPVIPEEELKEKEELPVVEENLQVNPEEQEADLEKSREWRTRRNRCKYRQVRRTCRDWRTRRTGNKDRPSRKNQLRKHLSLANLWKVHLSPDSVPTKTAIFKEELADFWVWLQGALKEPTASFDTDKRHSYTAFVLLTIFSATSFLFTVYHAKQGYYGRMAAIDSKALQHLPSLNLFFYLLHPGSDKFVLLLYPHGWICSQTFCRSK